VLFHRKAIKSLQETEKLEGAIFARFTEECLGSARQELEERSTILSFAAAALDLRSHPRYPLAPATGGVSKRATVLEMEKRLSSDKAMIVLIFYASNCNVVIETQFFESFL
jgi:hypothetical protein